MAKFKAGASGNPAGRPKGIKDRRIAMRELLKPHAADLVSKVVELAMAGDVQALRICIDRIIPPVREERLQIKLPDIASLTDCSTATAQIVTAVADGDLLPSEGEALAGLVEHQRRALETHDLAKRLEAIEQQLSKGKP